MQGKAVRERKSSSGHQWGLPRGDVVCLYVLVFVAVGWVGFTHCRYWLVGDAVFYVEDSRKVELDYVARNLDAWKNHFAGNPVQHKRLITEGGYAFLLAAARRLHLRLPFLLNGILLPFLFLALLGLVHLADDNPQRGLLSALLLGVLILAHAETARLWWYLTWPIRTLPAYLLGVLGLLTCVSACRRVPASAGRLFVAGLLMGVATWMRIPVVILAFPGCLYVLISSWSHSRTKSFWALVCLGSGVVMGLVPLIGQSVLEGAYHEVGQIGCAVLEAPRAQHKLGYEWAVWGWHPANFPSCSFRLLAHLRRSFSPSWCVMIALAVAWGFLRGVRQMALFLCAAVVFVLFYACEWSAACRYMTMTYLCLLAAPSIMVGHGLHAITSRLKNATALLVCYRVIPLLLAGAVVWLAWQQQGPKTESDRVWRDASRFGAWLTPHFRAADTFIIPHGAILSWAHGLGRICLTWPWAPEKTTGHRRINRMLAAGRRVFFLELRDEKGNAFASWWKDDLLSQYELEETDPSFSFRFRNLTLVPYQVVPARSLAAPLQCDGISSETKRLFLFARQLRHTNRWQAVSLACEGCSLSRTNKIQAGPNILELPSMCGDKFSHIRLVSDHPLPSFVFCKALGADPVVVELRGPKLRSLVPSHYRMFSGISFFWDASLHWHRDWGGIPCYAVGNGGAMRLPRCSRDVILRLYLIAAGPTKLTLDHLNKGIRYSVNECVVPSHVAVCFREFSAAAPKSKFRRHGVEFVHQLRIAPELLQAARAPELDLCPDLPFDPYLELRAFDYIVEEADSVRPEVPARGSREMKELRCIWPNNVTPHLKGILVRDPTFRVLDEAQSIKVPVSKEEGRRGVLLTLCRTERVCGDTPCTLDVWLNQRFIGSCSVPGDSVSSRLLLPNNEPCRAPRLHLVPRYSRRPTSPVTVSDVHEVRVNSDPVLPPDIGMGPTDDFAFALGDFHRAERQADGKYYRWTRGRSWLDVPLLVCPKVDILMRVVFRAPPVGNPEYAVTVTVNGHHIGHQVVTENHEIPETAVFKVPASVWSNGINRVYLTSSSWQPSEVLGTKDTRTLGIYVHAVEWESATPTGYVSSACLKAQ